MSKSYAALALVRALDKDTDPREFKSFVGTINEQVLALAEAIKKDPNVLIPDIMVISQPGEILTEKLLKQPVNVKLAIEKAEKTHAINMAAKAAKPNKVSVAKAVVPPLPKDNEIEDPPRVQAVSVEDYKREKSETSVVSTETKPVTQISNKNDSEKILEAIFKDMKCMTRSVAIMTVFSLQPGVEISVDDIAQHSKLTKADVKSFLSTTGKKIKCLIKGSKRGTYKLDPDLIT